MKLFELENIATDIKFFGSGLAAGTALVRNMGIYRAEVRMTEFTQIGIYAWLLGKIKRCNTMKASKYAGLRFSGETGAGHVQFEVEHPISGELTMWPQEMTLGFYRVSFPSGQQEHDHINFGFNDLFLLQHVIPPEHSKAGCIVMSSHMPGQLFADIFMPCGCTHYTIPNAIMVGFYRIITSDVTDPRHDRGALNFPCKRHGERK